MPHPNTEKRQILSYLAIVGDLPELVLVQLMARSYDTNPRYWTYNVVSQHVKPLIKDGLVEKLILPPIGLPTWMSYRNYYRLTPKGHDSIEIPDYKHRGLDMPHSLFFHTFGLRVMAGFMMKHYMFGRGCGMAIYYNALIPLKSGKNIHPDALVFLTLPSGHERHLIIEHERKNTDDQDKLDKYAQLDFNNLTVLKRSVTHANTKQKLIEEPLSKSTQVLFRVNEWDVDGHDVVYTPASITPGRKRGDTDALDRYMKKARKILPDNRYDKVFQTKKGQTTVQSSTRDLFYFTEGFNYFQPHEPVWRMLKDNNRYPLIPRDRFNS